MADGFEPHDHILLAASTRAAAVQCGSGMVGGEVYPGWGMGLGGSGGVLYRYPGPATPGPIFSHILALEPYPRPNEGLFTGFHEVS